MWTKKLTSPNPVLGSEPFFNYCKGGQIHRMKISVTHSKLFTVMISLVPPKGPLGIYLGDYTLKKGAYKTF